MAKYLYLTRKEWVSSWVNGGCIPILPASTYLSHSRSGTSTPDENLIHESPVDLLNVGLIGTTNPEKVNIQRVDTNNIVINGEKLPDVENGRYVHEDGLILSFSNAKSKTIARRLGKVACVKIRDIENLKTSIDEQLGLVGEMANCEYTNDHQRSHFLKSTEDSWQKEFRMFWPITEPRSILLPPHIAVAVKMKNLTRQ